jgi:hypothetical protein
VNKFQLPSGTLLYYVGESTTKPYRAGPRRVDTHHCVCRIVRERMISANSEIFLSRRQDSLGLAQVLLRLVSHDRYSRSCLPGTAVLPYSTVGTICRELVQVIPDRSTCTCTICRDCIRWELGVRLSPPVEKTLDNNNDCTILLIFCPISPPVVVGVLYSTSLSYWYK